MKKPSVLITFCTVAACTLFSGCYTTKAPSTDNTRIPATFDFSPPSRVAVGSAGMTIALLHPVYISKNQEYDIPPFDDMATSMANDFEELLTAKGFKILGPFKSRDEMVYSDKQNADFAFLVEIDLHPNYDRKYIYHAGYGTYVAPSYKMTGDVTVGGTLILTAVSPKYGEKIWKKNIALDASSFSYIGTRKWNGIPTVTDELQQDNVFYNDMARALEKFYAQALNLAWQQIDVAEMKTVADQSKKADAHQ